MRASRAPWVLLVCILLLLAACGSNADVCIPTTNTSPSTQTQGAISFATDHGVYAPGEIITVEATNNLRVRIKTQPTLPACPYVFLQQHVNGAWRNVAVCGLNSSTGDTAPAAIPLSLNSGQTYTVTIHTGYATPGIYRIALMYQTIPNKNAYDYVTAYSNTIQFCTCGKCG